MEDQNYDMFNNLENGKFPNLFNIFINPKKFYSNTKVYENKYFLFLAIWLVGISNSIDKISTRLFRASLKEVKTSSEEMMLKVSENWILFWLVVIIVGIMGGIMTYYIGGWWYNLRVKWCTDMDFDEYQIRKVYVYNYLIIAIPTFLITLLQTFIFKNYLDAYNNDNPIFMIELIFPFWAFFISYKILKHKIPNLKRGKAKLLFFIIPSVFMFLALGIGVSLASFVKSLS